MKHWCSKAGCVETHNGLSCWPWFLTSISYTISLVHVDYTLINQTRAFYRLKLLKLNRWICLMSNGCAQSLVNVFKMWNIQATLYFSIVFMWGILNITAICYFFPLLYVKINAFEAAVLHRSSIIVFICFTCWARVSMCGVDLSYHQLLPKMGAPLVQTTGQQHGYSYNHNCKWNIKQGK